MGQLQLVNGDGGLDQSEKGVKPISRFKGKW